MSTENHSEHPLKSDINAIFRNTPNPDSLTGRLQIAADIIRPKVNVYDELVAREKMHENQLGAHSRLVTVLSRIGLSGVVVRFGTTTPDNTITLFDASSKPEPRLKKDGIESEKNRFSDLSAADLALKASVDGIRAQYKLSQRQAQKALQLSRNRTKKISFRRK